MELSRRGPRKYYDFVYLTNTPSFYKLNLCEKLVLKNVKVLLVFYGYGSEAVNTVLNNNSQWGVDWVFLNNGSADKRSKVKVFFRLLALMRHITAKKILFSGWLASEYLTYAWLSPKKKNVILCESTILETTTSGIKGWIKRKLIGRMSVGLPSGILHKNLLTSLGLSKPQFITGSVGIFDKNHSSQIVAAKARIARVNDSSLRFLYVGRLIELKNLRLLINCFNRNRMSLTIVGAGPLEEELRSLAKENINIVGFVPNDELYKVYDEHDVFILPSRSETWGLVVEEALYRGLPVIYSDMVGCGPDMVANYDAGVKFDHTSVEDLQSAVDRITREFARFCSNVEKIDFNKREDLQIEAYIKALNE